ncbi:MAG: toll/interleukin-1 receptor domain-containing protein, partial [Geminicoccaceae bacterium]
MTDTPTIFISYSHRDEKPWKDFVQTHLKVVARQDGFLVWEDRRIRGGDDWRGEIDAALEQADIAVLLISPYFLTSDFILNHEVKELLKRKEQQGLRIYPILIIDCAWKSVDWLERLNLRPTDGQALASYHGNS